MSKQTRRSFLATTVVAACLPLKKAFSSATVVPVADQSPSGTVAVHVTAGDQRYSPSRALSWQSAEQARGKETITLTGTRSKQPILGFGAALTDAACYVIHQMPEAERERLLSPSRCSQQ